MRVAPGNSSTGTLISWPRWADGWAAAMFCSVVLETASTNPSPITLMVERSAITLVEAGITSSWSFGSNARSWMSEPPGWSTKVVPFQKPARRSTIWLVAPSVWFAMWHSPQPLPLKIGPEAVGGRLGAR